MTIKYYRKNVYGTEKMYIEDLRMKNLVATLTHKNTINVSDKLALENLGLKFKEVLPPGTKQFNYST